MFYNLHCPYDYVNFNLSSILILALAKFLYICELSCFSHVQLFVTLWTVVCQAPVSMGFSRQEYGVGCHALVQGIFLTQGLNPCLLCLLRCKQILYHWATGEARYIYIYVSYIKHRSVIFETRNKECFYLKKKICTVQYHSHQPHMPVEHLKYDSVYTHEEWNFKFYLVVVDLNSDSYCGLWLPYWTVQV